MELIRRLLVGLLGMIDSVVFQLIESTYNLLMDIARATPFENEIFSTFASRIYALLGLFMLFKVSFSLIKYIVNPDEFNDKVKGGKKMVMNILIVLVLIVGTPMVFDMMRKVQDVILEENVMEKLILGVGINGEVVDKANMGKKTKVAIFSAFYKPDDPVCGASDPANKEQFVADCTDFLGEEAAALYSDHYNNGSVYDMIHDEDPGEGEPLFMLKKKDNEKQYAINYMFLISTVAGVFTFLIFIGFCFDIAIRTVKLGFLELISPIPIISYIDPNSSKNGMFSRWVKEVGKTFLDLFIRLGAVYFAVTLIAALMKNTDLGTDNGLARVFIILGILLFAKQLPKLLGDLLGIKFDANFSLNPMNRLRETPIIGAVSAGLLGAAGGAYAGFKAGGEVGANRGVSGFLGALSGARQMFGKVGIGGARPGAQAPRAFGESMNSVFRQMTNREMTNLNPLNMFAGHMVRNRLEAVRTARNNASDRLVAAQVNQEAAYNQVQRSATALNRLNETDRRAFLEKASYYVSQARIRDDITKSADERNRASQNMARIRSEVAQTYTGDYADVAAHFNDRVAAQEANSQVTSISRDIEDLNKEKSQIERFGHIDPAATRDVNSLLDRYSSGYSDAELSAPTGSVRPGSPSDTTQIRPSLEETPMPPEESQIVVPPSGGGAPRSSTRSNSELDQYERELTGRLDENPFDEGLRRELDEIRRNRNN